MTIIAPGEWECSAAFVVAWPTRSAVWAPWRDRAEAEYTELIRALADHSEVRVYCRLEELERVTRRLPEAVVCDSWPIDDGWARDSGPLPVIRDGLRELINFGFNSWGDRYFPSSGDATLATRIAERAGLPLKSTPFVLEGGAISVNGQGTAVVVEECVLSPSRNGSIGRRRFEREVASALGITRVIWLPYGLLGDLKNTDGHVDNVAVFVAADRVVALVTPPGTPDHERLQTNLEVLRAARVGGVPLEVDVLDELPYAELPDGRREPSSYINFVLTDDRVLVPSVDKAADARVVSRFKELFPGREPVFLPSVYLAHGGGGLHCVTLNTWPA